MNMKKPNREKYLDALAEYLENPNELNFEKALKRAVDIDNANSDRVRSTKLHDQFVSIAKPLANGDRTAWGLFLYGIRRLQGHKIYDKLKRLSPYSGQYLIFAETDGEKITVTGDFLAELIRNKRSKKDGKTERYILPLPASMIDLW